MKAKNYNAVITLIIVVLIILLIAKYCSPKTISYTTPSSTEKKALDNSNLLLGNPTNATHSSDNPDNYLIDHIYYIESYNRSRCIPNWVCWHIGSNDLGSTDRLNDFRPDNNLPGGWFAVSPDLYKNSGFDKGHNCPSGDRTLTQDANSATFLMDNIIPQAPKNNEQVWEHLERYCRDQTAKGNEIYVMMGNYGVGGTGSRGYKTAIGKGKITVPAHIWKVVVILADGDNDLARINDKTRVIAIDTPNNNDVSNNWMDYVTTVSDIEKNCSCSLLTSLPVVLQNQIGNKRFTGGN